MKAIDKEQRADKERLVAALTDQVAEIEATIEKFNATQLEAFEAVKAELEKYNELLADAESLRDDVVSGIDGYMEERSEAWLEGDRGQAYQSWKENWENLDFDQMSINEPDAIEMPDTGHAEDLDSTSEELES